jgi:hypothetical protein
MSHRGGAYSFLRAQIYCFAPRSIVGMVHGSHHCEEMLIHVGALQVGRTLYKANPVLPESAGRAVTAKIDRAVFLSPSFGGPTEETPPPQGFDTFPLTVNTVPGTAFNMPPGRDTACTGHVIDGTREQLAAQIRAQDPLGAGWGGDVAGQPTGLQRSPTFSSYGWNTDVAGQLTTPTLVMQGIDDISVPGGAANAPAIYNALPASMTNKVWCRWDARAAKC